MEVNASGLIAIVETAVHPDGVRVLRYCSKEANSSSFSGFDNIQVARIVANARTGSIHVGAIPEALVSFDLPDYRFAPDDYWSLYTMEPIRD